MNPFLHFHMSNLLNPLFQVEGGGGGGSDTGDSDADQISEDLDALNEGEDDDSTDDESPEGEDESDKSGDDSESHESDESTGEEEEEEDDKEGKESEDDEDEQEDKEGDEGKEKIEGKPTFKQLKESGILKKMPGLKAVLANEIAYSRVFPDPQVAEEASNKAIFYDEIEDSIIKGDPSVILKNIKDNATPAYANFVKNLLPSLQKLDQDAYLEVTAPILETLLFNAAKYGEKKGNKNLINAAKHISDYVFGNGGEIPDITKRTERHPAEIELERERNKAKELNLNTAKGDVNTRIDRSLMGFVTENFPGGLSTMEKNYITSQVLDATMSELTKDTVFSNRMQALWKRAEISGYSEQSKVAIQNAYIARAKAVAKTKRDELVKEALKGRSGRGKVIEKGKVEEKGPRKRQFDSRGRGGSQGSMRRSAVLDPSKIDYKRTSDLDILSGDEGRVKLKGQR